jgi:Ser/Thr protein kinase RdoA (MazF antagonist)
MAALTGYEPRTLPLPNPDWVRWDYTGPKIWPPHVAVDAAPNQAPLPAYLDDAADRVRRRMRRCSLPNVVGHGDWETQNLRWLHDRALVIHDWDSVVFMPEAAIVGAAAGAFASNEIPTLAGINSSEAFLDAYQVQRDRSFSAEEIQVAWAASLWPAIHNARGEFRFNLTPIAGKQLAEQADERLERAGA